MDPIYTKDKILESLPKIEINLDLFQGNLTDYPIAQYLKEFAEKIHTDSDCFELFLDLLPTKESKIKSPLTIDQKVDVDLFFNIAFDSVLKKSFSAMNDIIVSAGDFNGERGQAVKLVIEQFFSRVALGDLEFSEKAYKFLDAFLELATSVSYKNKSALLGAMRDLSVKYRNATVLRKINKISQKNVDGIRSDENNVLIDFLLNTTCPIAVSNAYYSLEQKERSLSPFSAAISCAERKKRKKSYVFDPIVLNDGSENSMNDFASYVMNGMVDGAEKVVLVPGSHWNCFLIKKENKETVKVIYFDSAGGGHPERLESMPQYKRHPLLNLMKALALKKAQLITYVNKEKQQHATFGCREFSIWMAEKIAVAHRYVPTGDLFQYFEKMDFSEKVAIFVNLEKVGLSFFNVPFPPSLIRATQSRDIISRFTAFKTPVKKSGELPTEEFLKKPFKNIDGNIDGKKRNVLILKKRQKRFDYAVAFLKTHNDKQCKELADKILFSRILSIKPSEAPVVPVEVPVIHVEVPVDPIKSPVVPLENPVNIAQKIEIKKTIGSRILAHINKYPLYKWLGIRFVANLIFGRPVEPDTIAAGPMNKDDSHSSKAVANDSAALIFSSSKRTAPEKTTTHKKKCFRFGCC